MTNKWKPATLKDLCIVDWGNTSLTKKSYTDGGEFLAVSASGCDGRIGHKEHTRHTPVLSAIGAQCGKMFFPEEDFTAIKNTITLTPLDGVCDGRFLYYLLTFVDLPQRGAGQPFISKGDIQKFTVEYPPLPEQRRIVGILDEAFAGIATAKANAEKNLRKLKRHDVVLTTRGTIGNIGLYSPDVPFGDIRINSGMLILRSNKSVLLPSYLFELLRSGIVKDQIKRRTTGAAQPQLPIKTLVHFNVPVPEHLDDQRALVEKLHALEPATQHLESIYQRKLAALNELKKSLLHQAFSGKL